MAARKLQQEVDKCFKKVDEGVTEFESIYEKIEQSTNLAQKEKLEDNLKKEIKKLQRLRDQIKTWAASNEVKDKGPLMDKRKLIETQMEKFKAVEKAMKTKAYSKEGLSAATKMDPKERAKAEAYEFLSNMVEELERQTETLEAEGEGIQATMKKGKNHSGKADRMAEIERITGRHKWHQGKLELIKRSLENGGVETEQVNDLEDSIRYYVSDGMNEDYMEDEEMYDDLNLEEEEEIYGVINDNDHVSSQDTQSIQDDTPEPETRSSSIPAGKAKVAAAPEGPAATGRRPSTQMKSPAPALATLHTPLSNISNGLSNMKPAALPTRAPGEILKYASAAAAAAANDKNGLAPLPPPPDALPPPVTSASHPPTSSHAAKIPSVSGPSPSTVHSQPVSCSQTPAIRSSVPAATTGSDVPSSSQTKSPALSQSSAAPSGSIISQQAVERADSARPVISRGSSGKGLAAPEVGESSKATSLQSNGVTNGTKIAPAKDDSYYHLPPGFDDLVQAMEATTNRASNASSAASQRMLTVSHANAPDVLTIGAPQTYRPASKYPTAPYFPQDLNSIFDRPELYSRIDPDTLFYIFYYMQGTYQQYLAAKALKDQSWRFHKQYQTWFQRHEEPKTITEEYEQGTYRFFDYESTWMNRRKADFKFAYKFLEDDV